MSTSTLDNIVEMELIVIAVSLIDKFDVWLGTSGDETS